MLAALMRRVRAARPQSDVPIVFVRGYRKITPVRFRQVGSLLQRADGRRRNHLDADVGRSTLAKLRGQLLKSSMCQSSLEARNELLPALLLQRPAFESRY